VRKKCVKSAQKARKKLAECDVVVSVEKLAVGLYQRSFEEHTKMAVPIRSNHETAADIKFINHETV